MAYQKTVWKNNQSPPIDETNLNKIESGIESVSSDLDTLQTNFTNYQSRQSELLADINDRISDVVTDVTDTQFDIQDLQDKVGILEDDYWAVQNELDTQWLEISQKGNKSVGSESGTEIVLTDSEKDRVADFSMQGVTRQGDNPSPSYPQPIENAVDAVIEVNGKNMCNGVTYGRFLNSITGLESDTIAISCVSDFIKIKPTEIYTVNFLNKLNSFIAFYDKDKNFISRTGGASKTFETVGKGYTYTIPSNAKYVRFTQYFIQGTNTGTLEELKAFKYQFEIGSEVTAYQPYQSQTITLQGITLTKWDRLERRNNVWGVAKKSASVDLGTLSWGMATVSNYNIFICSYLSDTNRVRNIGYCEKYRQVAGSDYATNNSFYFNQSNTVFVNNGISNATDFKASVQGVMFQYETNTETFIPLTDQTTISQLNALSTYKPTTVITNDDGCNMNVGYTVDVIKYIDKKFDELAMLMVASASETN